MADHQHEVGLGLKMGETTHFNDLTNLVTSPRNALTQVHNGAEVGQQAQNGLVHQSHVSTAQGASYDTSSQGTLMKHGATDLNVFNDAQLGGENTQSTGGPCQSQQSEGNRLPEATDPPSADPQSAGLAQAFNVDMTSQSNNAQRPVQPTADVHDYFCPPVQSSDSQETIQGHTATDGGARQAQMMHDQPHAVAMQLKAEPSPGFERHQVKSYPSSPPSRSQTLQQADLRSFEGGMRPAEGRHVPSHRPSHSLGQAAAFMSGVPNRDMFAHNHVSAPVSPSEGIGAGPFPTLFHYPAPRHEMGINMADHGHMFDQAGHPIDARNSGYFTRSCAPSVRSTSPSASMASTSMTSISPLGSARINPDGSFTSQETSFDSLSNAASGSFSRASSTSEDVFSYDMGSLGLAHSLRMSKQKKKLRNIDRKLICDYSIANPTIKQDAIANEFGIERSTVSKILKQKEKWLAIDPSSDAARIAKHRAVKFPAVEDRLTTWVAALKAQGEPIRDSTIRNEALRIARELGLGEDKFKASGGWIEKFRERNAIPKPSADAISTTPDVSEATREPTPSPSRGAVPLAPRPAPPMDVSSMPPINTAGNGAQTQPARRQPARGSKAKGTPQKRARDEEIKTQAILGMSPLSQDMARMHFQNVGPPAPMPDAAFFRPNFYEGYPAQPQQPMQNCHLIYEMHDVPGTPHPMDDGDHDRKRRRAIQEVQGPQAAMGLGPPIEFQFPPPQGTAPGSSSQMTMPDQLPQNLSQADMSPEKGSPRKSRAAATPAASSTRGRARRGKGRLSNANHTPQTPSPLSMSPADGRSETSFRGLNAADAEQFTAATLERLRALHSSGDKSSIVTAEQAQQSLELVLRFLSEQPSGFVPPNHFVVFGHLQANIEQKIKDESRDSPEAEGSGTQSQPQPQSQGSQQIASPNGEGLTANAGGQ
ncbi:uncharacterized protein UTRI_00467 [Ustilago trichophora]|uniref:HTH CENPB-type domain-containing protein n=1 Tax=Ustilago trichophora TaxID=86804 RepID=A0A5C3DTL1_9BASI|nr:uncharacterized protein UTRI_00467 [Ustilago trichophora]